MANFSASAHWRDSAREARFFIVDARAAFPLLLYLLHMRWWSFGLAVTAMIFFVVIEHFGFTVPVFRRWLKNFLAGPQKSAIPWWKN